MDRLFVYGSLQPGGPNEHVLAALDGEWQPGVVRGRLVKAGWGTEMGYPALVIDELDVGDGVSGFVFASPALGGAWAHLDTFEGPEYQRIETDVVVDGGARVRAHVYVLRTETGR